MPISNGFCKWPASYWTKPEPKPISFSRRSILRETVPARSRSLHQKSLRSVRRSSSVITFDDSETYRVTPQASRRPRGDRGRNAPECLAMEALPKPSTLAQGPPSSAEAFYENVEAGQQRNVARSDEDTQTGQIVSIK